MFISHSITAHFMDDGKIKFTDSICSCKNCNHKLSRNCIKFECKCCGTKDHMMVIDGMKDLIDRHKK